VKSQGRPQTPQPQRQNSSWHRRQSSLWGAGPLQLCWRHWTPPRHSTDGWGDTASFQLASCTIEAVSCWSQCFPTRKGTGRCRAQLSSRHLCALSYSKRTMSTEKWKQKTQGTGSTCVTLPHSGPCYLLLTLRERLLLTSAGFGSDPEVLSCAHGSVRPCLLRQEWARSMTTRFRRHHINTFLLGHLRFTVHFLTWGNREQALDASGPRGTAGLHLPDDSWRDWKAEEQGGQPTLSLLSSDAPLRSFQGRRQTSWTQIPAQPLKVCLMQPVALQSYLMHELQSKLRWRALNTSSEQSSDEATTTSKWPQSENPKDIAPHQLKPS